MKIKKVFHEKDIRMLCSVLMGVECGNVFHSQQKHTQKTTEMRKIQDAQKVKNITLVK